MKHFGDITKLSGHELPLVDVCVGGSPCQDLSVAGKRAGLAGERSGLFMEQIRLIKEMRDESRQRLCSRGADVDFRLLRPRFMVWENVPGAFSSNGGEDFRAVLEETARVVCEDAVIPGPSGRWSTSGAIMGDGWSIAWRVHDAQFWGVPQRRKRISLVADFGGESAPEILFERKSVSGDIAESAETGKEVAGVTGENIGNTSLLDEWVAAVNASAKHQQDLIQHDQGIARTLAPGTHASGSHLTKTLITRGENPSEPSTINPSCLNPWDVQSKHIQSENGIAESLYAGECRYGGGESYVAQTSATCYGISSYESNAMKSANPNSGIYRADTSRTLDLNGGNPACNQGGMVVLEGNGSRPSHQGDGFRESEVSYTLNSTEQHAICFSETASARCAHDGRGAVHSQMMANPEGNFVLEQIPEESGGQPAQGINGDIAGTLDANYYKGCGERQGTEREVVCVGNGQLAQARLSDKVGALNCMHDQQAIITYGVDCYNQTQAEEVSKSLSSAATDSDHVPCVYGIDRASFNQGQNAQYDFSVIEEQAQTLISRGPGGY